MARIIFGEPSGRLFSSGVHNGIISISGRNYPWNGLISVEKSNLGNNNQYNYLDSARVSVSSSASDVAYSINAYYYPTAVEEVIGLVTTSGGAQYSTNRQKLCNIAWMTNIESSSGEKFKRYHLLYNALLSLPSVKHQTNSDNLNVETFSFDVKTLSLSLKGQTVNSEIVIDGRYASENTMRIIDTWLYGGVRINPKWPTINDILRVTTSDTTFDIGSEHQNSGTFNLISGETTKGSTSDGLYSIINTNVVVETTNKGIYEKR